jgi:hypothetical protein
MPIDVEFQTRDSDGTIQFWSSFRQALEVAKENNEIWKISFPLPTGERIRLVRRETSLWDSETDDWEAEWVVEQIAFPIPDGELK